MQAESAWYRDTLAPVTGKNNNKQMGDVMSDRAIGRVHWSFWLIGAVALIWNVLSAANFFAQMSPEMLDAYRESERAIIQGRPAWATAAFAIAAFGGVLGSLLLLFRRSVAIYLFVASLTGVIVTMVHTLGSGIDFGLGEMLGIILMPIVVAAFLIWYSRHTTSKGWIN